MNDLSDDQLFCGIGDALAKFTALITELAERRQCASTFASHLETQQTTGCSKAVSTNCRRISSYQRLTGEEPHVLEGPEVLVPLAHYSGRDEWASCDIQFAQSKLVDELACTEPLQTGSHKLTSTLTSSTSWYSHSHSTDSAQRNLWIACWTIHPQSFQRVLWDILSMLLILQGLLVLPLAAFELPSTSFVLVSEYVAALFFSFDIVMSFRTGFFSGMQLEMGARLIACRYMKTWLIPDICIVSVEWMLQTQDGILQTQDGISVNSARLNRMARVARFFRMLRYLKLMQAFKKLEAIFSSNSLLLCFSLVRMGLFVALAMHFMTCGWYAVGKQAHGWVRKNGHDLNMNFWQQYLSSTQWALAQINGRTDQVQDRTTAEKLYTCMCAISGILIKSVFVSSMTARMLRLQSVMAERTKYMRDLNCYLDRHKVSWNAAYFARKHAKNLTETGTSSISYDEVDLLNPLPKQLQAELLFEARSPHLMRHPFLDYISGKSYCLRSLCSQATTSVPARSTEVVFERGMQCNRMIFVELGELVYSTHEDLNPQMAEFAHVSMRCESKKWGKKLLVQEAVPLKDHVAGHEVASGVWLSEAALWLHWKHNGGLVATTDCQLLELDAKEFARTVKQFHEVDSFCGMYARAFCKLFIQQPSDLQEGNPPRDVGRFCLENAQFDEVWSEATSSYAIESKAACQAAKLSL